MNWDDSLRKHFSLIGCEQVISLSHTKVHVFSNSVLCFGKMNENPQSNYAWEDKENERECELSAQLVSMCAKRFSPGRWTFLD